VDWQRRLPGSVPVLCKRMHRVFWVPKRYVGLVAIGLFGPFTMRDAAERTGYSLHGVWAAARSLEEMAIARFTSSRGRRGSTRMLLSSDASAGNVPTTVTTLGRETVTTSETEQGTFDLTAYAALVRDKLRARLGLAAT
jgi:hypothetical protein